MRRCAVHKVGKGLSGVAGKEPQDDDDRDRDTDEPKQCRAHRRSPGGMSANNRRGGALFPAEPSCRDSSRAPALIGDAVSSFVVHHDVPHAALASLHACIVARKNVEAYPNREPWRGPEHYSGRDWQWGCVNELHSRRARIGERRGLCSELSRPLLVVATRPASRC